MRCSIVILNFFLFLSGNLFSQTTITGVVTDATNAPVAFAAVYLSKTTIGNTTNNGGA
jgi:hypothetical protein